MKTKKKVLLFIILIAAAALLAGAVIWKIEAKKQIVRPPTIEGIQRREGIPVRTTSPARREMPVVLLLDGTIEPETRAVLVSRLNRMIDSITVDEGDRINRGDAAIFLEKESVESSVKAGQTALEEERRNFQRAQALFEAGAISRQELDRAGVNVNQAEANYLKARDMLQDTRISSPLTGLVSRRYKEPGELSDEGKPILEIVDITGVEAHCPVSEMLIREVRIGQTAFVYPDAYPGRIWEAKIDTVNPTAQGSSRLFTVKIKIPNPEGLLMPGMYARVEIVIDLHPGATVLPQEAIVKNPRGEQGVFLVEQNTGIVRFMPVTPGVAYRGLIEVTGELPPDAPVVISGQERLTEGSRVKIISER
ncbi:MAG: efflux RND transporter periplasmic adaptor subunit [PVC group bacterium]